ncbi:MAG: hypothetical protein JWQ43_381 [Glaciihabitans sp.]|nr:hypothetical protein [Glaciihabitans sp.]
MIALLAMAFGWMTRTLQRGEHWFVDTKHALYGASLARIIYGLVVVLFVLANFPQRNYLWGSAAGWVDPIKSFSDWAFPFTFYTPGEADWLFTIKFLLLGVAGVALLVGWHSRISAIVTLYLYISLVTTNPVASDQTDNAFRIILFYFVFADTSAHWSLDARRRSRKLSPHPLGSPLRLEQQQLVRQSPADLRAADLRAAPVRARQPVAQRATPLSPRQWVPNIIHNGAIVAVTLQIFIIYVVAGLSKVKGSQWQDGTAVYYPLNLQSLTPWPWLSDLATQNSLLVNFVTYFAVFIQLFFPFLLLARWTRVIALLGIVGMHAGIGVLMGLPLFSMAMMAADALFVRDVTYAKAEAYVKSTTIPWVRKRLHLRELSQPRKGEPFAPELLAPAPEIVPTSTELPVPAPQRRSGWRRAFALAAPSENKSQASAEQAPQQDQLQDQDQDQGQGQDQDQLQDQDQDQDQGQVQDQLQDQGQDQLQDNKLDDQIEALSPVPIEGSAPRAVSPVTKASSPAPMEVPPASPPAPTTAEPVDVEPERVVEPVDAPAQAAAPLSTPVVVSATAVVPPAGDIPVPAPVAVPTEPVAPLEPKRVEPELVEPELLEPKLVEPKQLEPTPVDGTPLPAPSASVPIPTPVSASSPILPDSVADSAPQSVPEVPPVRARRSAAAPHGTRVTARGPAPEARPAAAEATTPNVAPPASASPASRAASASQTSPVPSTGETTSTGSHRALSPRRMARAAAIGDLPVAQPTTERSFASPAQGADAGPTAEASEVVESTGTSETDIPMRRPRIRSR